MSGFDQGEFMYDDYDMVRDVRNYTSKLNLSSPAAADRAVEDLSVRDLLEQIRETTDRDLDFNPASSELSGDLPGDTSGSGGDSNSHGSSGRGSCGGSASRGGRGSHGGDATGGRRGGFTSQRTTTRSTANAPNARTINELRCLAFYTKGELTDIARKDDCNPVSFVEYVHAVKTTQPNFPRHFQEAMKMSDADLWR